MISCRSYVYAGVTLLFALRGALSAQVYFVSPTGSDSNSGTSPRSPWQTLAKVDSTNFAPGSQILFQAGGNWYGQQLTASSSGTPADPITYGSYGSGANPTFWGSVPVSASSFQPVANEPNTYFYPTTTPVNAFLVNHQFTDDATLVSNQTTDAGNIGYVESTPNTSYYDPDGTPGLYVNLGTPINSGNIYTAAIQDNVVLDDGQNNLVFENLNVSESAKANAGYGIAIQNASNVQLLNSNVIAAGKHGVSVLNTTGFVGKNLTASYLMPDQGYGGATGFVAFADSRVSNTTSQWINDTFTNADGPYQAFITHTDVTTSNATPIASVLLQNLVTDSNPGISIFTSGNEHVSIIGGQVTNGVVGLSGNYTTINGMLLSGPNASIQIASGASGNVIENTIINGAAPNWHGGQDGAIVDAGQGSVIRFNTIVMSPASGTVGAAIGLENNSTNSQIYGNIIDTPYAAFFQRDSGMPTITSFDNLFTGTGTPQVIFFDNSSQDAAISGWPKTISAKEIFGNPNFVNPATGDFVLQPRSIAAYVFDPTTNEYVLNDYYGNQRPTTLDSLGAIQSPLPQIIAIPEPASIALVAFIPLLMRRSPATHAIG